MVSEVYVFVYLPGVIEAIPAGRLLLDEDARHGLFEYGRRYLQRTEAVPVDPVALPLGPSRYECRKINRGLFGALRDALPDYWGRLVIATQMRIAVEALSDAELMLRPNATRAGNLDFRPAPDAPEPVLGPPDFADLTALLAGAERIQAGEAVDDPLAVLLIQGSSLGGARPKCTVRWREALWIAKFPARNEDYSVPRVEYATLRLAARCGIRIPEVRLEPIGGRDVLLVRRFDRRPMAGGDARVGYLSALSLMQRDESERFGYPDIADRMRQQGMAGLENQAELFRRMVFNLLVRNTDDHARNHGFLFDGQRLHLSPAFDLVPTPARPGVGTEFNLALELGVQGRHASVDNALSRAARFGLERAAAIQVMREVAREVAGWRERFAADGVDEATLERLRHGFTGRFIGEINMA